MKRSSTYHQWGRIKATISRSAPCRIIFVDTETTEEAVRKDRLLQSLYCGVAVYWQAKRSRSPEKEEWLHFKTAGEFWEWALAKVTPRNPVLLVSHNMGFDLQVLSALHELPKRGWNISQLYERGNTFLMLISEPTAQLRAHLAEGKEWYEFKGPRWNKKLRCVDNWNLFPGTLEALGASIGSEKLEMPGRDADEATWNAYCRQDVKILLEAWKLRRAFILDNDLGRMMPTIGGQAFTTYRYGFMSEEIRRHRDPEALELERDAFRGGRVEAFFVGKIPDPPVYRLDVNSLYPYVMAVRKYPTEITGKLDNISLEYLRRLLDKGCVIADVDLHCSEPVFPVLTVERNWYPTGFRRQTLTTPELAYALERQWIKRVHRCTTYRAADLFSEYVIFWYNKKLEASRRGDSVEYTAAKLMLNSLPGKFGQKGRESRVLGTCDPSWLRVEHGWDATLKCRYQLTYVGGLVTETYSIGESTFSCPAIAAHVNAEARMYMWRMMQQARRKNVYYTDTDSLFVNQQGRDKLSFRIDPDLLGALKLESVGQDVIIHCPKDYEWDGKRTLKGIPKTAHQLDPNTYSVIDWPSFTSHIAHNRPMGYVKMIYNKTLKRDVTWGTLLPSGWVQPIRIIEDGTEYNEDTLSGQGVATWSYNPSAADPRLRLTFTQH